MTVSMPLSLGFLPRSQQESMIQLTSRILDSVKLEMILCYGIRSVHGQYWGCFLDQGTVKDNQRLSIDLFIVIDDEKGQNEQDISQLIEQLCKPLADVRYITHKMHSIKERLDNDHPFYSPIFWDGITLYGSEKLVLPRQTRAANNDPERHTIEGIWSRWYGLGQNFYKGAIDSLSYDTPDLTGFLLHQAVEHTCGALIRVFTGYRPNTHNLFRLLLMK